MSSTKFTLENHSINLGKTTKSLSNVIWMCICVNVHECAHVLASHSMLSAIIPQVLFTLFSFILKQGLSLSRKTRLAGKNIPGIFLFKSPLQRL